MLKSCLPYLGSPDCIEIEKEEKKKNNYNNNNNSNESKGKELESLELGGQNYNFGCCSLDEEESSRTWSWWRSKQQIFVRVIHAGGKVDKYPNAILAGEVLENIPVGKWLARPEVFKSPHDSILYPQEYLLPGRKYYVIPLSTIHKLINRSKHQYNKITTLPNNNYNGRTIHNQLHPLDPHQQPTTTTDHHQIHGELNMEEEDYSSFSCASEFYGSKNKYWWTTTSTSSSTSTSTSSSSTSTSSSSGNNNNNNNNNNGSSGGGGGVGGSRRPLARILLPVAKPKVVLNNNNTTWEPGLSSIQELSP